MEVLARPAVNIGTDQDKAALTGGLLGMLIVEHINGIYRLEALFGNLGNKNNAVDFLHFGRRTLEFGKAIEITYEGNTLFKGKITGLEAKFSAETPPQLNVLAEDRFQDLRMTRRTKTFTDVSDADLIRQIAGDHRLQAKVSVSGPTHKVLAQLNQSDLAFLRDRARAIDAELWMEGDTLNARSRPARGSGVLQMIHGQGNQSSLTEFSVIADLAGQRTSLGVSGWDVSSKSAINHEATDSVMQSELNNEDNGASILKSAFGERKEAVEHAVPFTPQEAQVAAESFFKMRARRFVVGRGVAKTDNRIRAGNFVDLQGIGPLFSGKYYLVEVRHLFDENGLRTEFTAERPGLGKPSS